MTSETKQFFEALSGSHEPLMEMQKGVLRFDILDNGRSERWIVAIDDGDIAVSRQNVTGDCTLRMSRALFERVIRREANGMAAFLRGELEVEGDWHLLVLARRLITA
jgi:putative sterol carrier protein